MFEYHYCIIYNLCDARLAVAVWCGRPRGYHVVLLRFPFSLRHQIDQPVRAPRLSYGEESRPHRYQGRTTKLLLSEQAEAYMCREPTGICLYD